MKQYVCTEVDVWADVEKAFVQRPNGASQWTLRRQRNCKGVDVALFPETFLFAPHSGGRASLPARVHCLTQPRPLIK